MYLKPEKGSCALAVLKLCLHVIHLLAESPSGFTRVQGPSYTFIFINLSWLFSQNIILQDFSLVFLLSPLAVIIIWMHRIIEPMELTAGEMNICVPPETPTGSSSAGSQPPSMEGVHIPQSQEPTEPNSGARAADVVTVEPTAPWQRQEPRQGRTRGSRSARAGKEAYAVLWIKNERRML